ncbi:uncharacterized protein LOC131003479 isoform X1 [Salvia miltiorrhiza]|uniref:uncharacterized protein LOC131003479 isoform X1 n=1 Tax=Salvia miltiorrhiza TaxID=226208 RepID=UPI0025AD1B44|nr:uncharacterized protein LOC131003479 isoform X1 [Salvia miltiorrhiza]
MGDGNNHSMWGHLPLLVRASSKESVEYILQALWRTRRTGLDAADRQIFRDILQLPNDSDLDPLLVCLRVLIRRCVYDNVNKDEIQKLFPAEVLPELQRLLTLLLQKFQREWRQDISKDQVILPRLKSMTWNMANQSVEQTEPAAVINLQLHGDSQPNVGERDVKFQLAKDTMEMMLKSMYSIRGQLSEPVSVTVNDCNCISFLFIFMANLLSFNPFFSCQDETPDRQLVQD